MVKVGIGEENPFQTGSTHAVGRGQQRWKGFDLEAYVRRSVQQKPSSAVCANSHTRLGPRSGPQRSRAQAAAVGTIAIPLGKATARRRAQQAYLHFSSRIILIGR